MSAWKGKKGFAWNLIVLLGLSLAGCATTGPKEPERFIYLDPADTLQIAFVYSGNPRYEMDAPSLADAMREERRRFFEKAIQAVLPLVDLPMNYRILDERENAEEGHPVLRIYALRWDVNRLGELESVIRVTLESYGERNVLGTFSTREQAFGMNSEMRRQQQFIQVMIKSLTEMFSELMMHFEAPAGLNEGPARETGQ